MSLDANRGLKELKKLWSDILEIPEESAYKKYFIEDQKIISYIREILRGRNKSYRYALLTQLLAKWLRPSINALTLQKQARVEGAFDARSFCRKVVVAFEKDFLKNLLGGADDPYVSKPLRHSMITLDKSVFQHIKNKNGWKKLYYILYLVQSRNEKSFTEKVLKQVLLEVRRLQLELKKFAKALKSVKPSITAYELRQIISKFLETPSEGARAQGIVYALMRVLNKRTEAFERVESSKSTIADTYARKLADIECFGKNGSIKVGIAVTEALDYQKLREELEKAVNRGLGKLIIVAHTIKPNFDARKVVSEYEDKIDIAINELENFVITMTTLLNNEMRKELIGEVGKVLEELGYLDHLKAWYKTVAGLLNAQMP